ncbi:MAG: hypothetical protein IMF19_04680 [Proteobacteria bacterium]|nr:hypothetical protein [Pseudomonadota bacterium]
MKLGKAIPLHITIMSTDSQGFIIDIGFASFACETVETTMKVLADYLRDPTLFISALELARKISIKPLDSAPISRDQIKVPLEF